MGSVTFLSDFNKAQIIMDRHLETSISEMVHLVGCPSVVVVLHSSLQKCCRKKMMKCDPAANSINLDSNFCNSSREE